MKRIVVYILFLVASALTLSASDGVTVRWTPLGPDAGAYDSMMERAAFLDIPRRDLGAMAGSGQETSDARVSRQIRARNSYWRGWVIAHSDPDSALRLVDEALRMCDSVRYPYDQARFALLRADLLRFTGNYADAYFIYRDKIGELRQHGDDFWVAKALVGIGAIMQELGEYHEAMRNYSEAQETFARAGSTACVTKNRLNLANIHYLMGDTEKSLGLLKDLERSRQVANDSIYVANVLVSRFQISDYSDREAASRAFAISRRLGNDKLSVITLLSMGALARSDGDSRKALGYLRPALGLTAALGDISNRKHALSQMRICYDDLGMKDSSEMCSREILLLNDSLYHRENVENLKRVEHLATIHEYERRIEQESERHRLRQTLVLAVSAFLLVVLVLSVFLLISSKRKAESDRNLKEEKNRHLTLLNRQYSMEIEAKAKELASNTVLLAQKNARLKELGEQIRNMERKGDIAGDEGQMLSDKISSELSADDDWRFFKLRFDRVHPCFFMSLKEAYPSLSRTELRLCAYIRVGMSAKEIAMIMSVRPETVNTSRYRIRKKMSLSAEDSLESVLEHY